MAVFAPLFSKNISKDNKTITFKYILCNLNLFMTSYDKQCPIILHAMTCIDLMYLGSVENCSVLHLLTTTTARIEIITIKSKFVKYLNIYYDR